MLMFLGREQTAHEVAYVVEVGEAVYQHGGNTLGVYAHDEGISVMTSSGDDSTSCDAPMSDVRVYNALIQLIRAIQVHYEESEGPSVQGIVANPGGQEDT